MNIDNLKPYIQDSFSFAISLFCCFSLYQYNKNKNILWFKLIWVIFTVYLISDLYIGAGIDFWIHHIASIIINIVGMIHTYNFICK